MGNKFLFKTTHERNRSHSRRSASRLVFRTGSFLLGSSNRLRHDADERRTWGWPGHSSSSFSPAAFCADVVFVEVEAGSSSSCVALSFLTPTSAPSHVTEFLLLPQ